MAIDDPYVAYCYDQAISYFGHHVESELDKLDKPKGKQAAEGKRLQRKREQKLDQLLGLDKQPKKAGTQFADPAAMMTK
jgi:hypothetical protein